jgi:hypothetical protein
MALVVTNSDEGSLFLNASFEEEYDVATYTSLTFPRLSQDEIKSVVDAYAGLGSNFDQMALIQGECK